MRARPNWTCLRGALLVASLTLAACGNDPTPAEPKVKGLQVEPDDVCRPCEKGVCPIGFACTSLDSMAGSPDVCAARCTADSDCADLFPGRKGVCVAAAPGDDNTLHPLPAQGSTGEQPDAFAPCQGGTCVCTTDQAWCPHRCLAGKWESCNSKGLEDPDGCEQDLAKPEFCGTCDTHHDCGKAFPNAVGTCEDGLRCILPPGSCKEGWGDCDNLAHNGCETKLDSDAHCGACNQACGVKNHVLTRCQASTCVYRTEVVDQQVKLQCDGDWADCQTREECQAPMTLAQAQSCLQLIRDDEGSAAGCDTPLGTMANCSGCGKACKSTDSQPHTCTDKQCVVSDCPVGQARCNGACVPLGLDSRCGSCSESCLNESVSAQGGKCCVQVMTPADPTQPPSAEGCIPLSKALADAQGDKALSQEAVEALACHTFQCKAGWANCDASKDGSCETHVDNDIHNCGACNLDCVTESKKYGHVTATACTSGKCTFACEDGFTTCGSDSVCLVKLGSNLHCKDCGDKCKNGMQCTKGACQCPPDKVGCYKDGQVWCKTPGVDFCEVCGDKCLQSNACSLEGANWKCKPCKGATGYCVAGQGCIPINTVERCGSCDNNCLAGVPKFVQYDTSGQPKVQCSLISGQYKCDYACKAGYGDCDQAISGCESSMSKWPHCGACNACEAIQNVSIEAQTCQAGPGETPCAAWKKPTAKVNTQTVSIGDKQLTVPWNSGCNFGYFDCTEEGGPLDGCECRTALTWSEPPAWLLNCSPGCGTNQSCSCDYEALKAIICPEASDKCLP